MSQIVNIDENIISNRDQIELHTRKVQEFISDLLSEGNNIKCVKVKTPIYSYSSTYPTSYQPIVMSVFSLVNRQDFIEVVSLADRHVPYYEYIPEPFTGQYGVSCTSTFYCIDQYPLHTKILSIWIIDTPLLPTQRLKNY